jgi:phage repressor protein C with HTH and peptisase S24 domain
MHNNLPTITSITNIAFIHAIGDSMTPTFNDGDILLVDVGIKEVKSDAIYVLEALDRLFIKRVRQRLDGQYEISSDNPNVKTVDILNGDNQVSIRGRVVWLWNGKRL